MDGMLLGLIVWTRYIITSVFRLYPSYDIVMFLCRRETRILPAQPCFRPNPPRALVNLCPSMIVASRNGDSGRDFDDFLVSYHEQSGQVC